jgi:hypothetical protein
MRKVIVFAFYSLMIVVGVAFAFNWLTFGGRGVVFRAGGFLAVFGGYLMWSDFFSPSRGKI